MIQDLKYYEQARAESRYHVFDFTGDLIDGAVLSSATATLTNPSGSAVTPAPTAAIDAVTNKVYVLVTGATHLATTGSYTLVCYPVVDNAASLNDETLAASRVIRVNL